MASSDSEGRSADRWAINDLIVAYADAVDAQDWERFEGLFVPDAHIDYTSAGGIAGTPAELAAWMPEAFTAFIWTLHSMSTHAVVFEGQDAASGSLHVVARHGVSFDGAHERLDVGGTYEDRYVRRDGRWLFARRVEHTYYMSGGRFADLVREAAGLEFSA